ncbi:hypothetical protein D3C71_1920760 [compost metagenome]
MSSLNLTTALYSFAFPVDATVTTATSSFFSATGLISSSTDLLTFPTLKPKLSCVIVVVVALPFNLKVAFGVGASLLLLVIVK